MPTRMTRGAESPTEGLMEADRPAGSPTSLNVTIVDSVEAFEALHEEWQQLLDKTPANCIFLTWEWLYTWWKWYGGDGRLFILLFRDPGGHLRAIAPFMIRKAMGVFHKLQLIGSESRVCSDYLDIIAEKGWENDSARTILNFLLKSQRPWHVLVLSSIPANSSFLAALRRLPEFCRLKSKQRTLTTAARLSYPDTWDELLAKLGPRTRRNIRRYRKKLERSFQVELVPSSSLYNETRTVEAMRRLQRKSISRKGLRGIFDDKTYASFHTDILNLLKERGWLYVVFLLCDGRPAAFVYCYIYAGTAYGYQKGFDTDFRSFSIGTLVQSYVFQDTLSRGIRSFDFLRGQEEDKSHFSDSVREMLELSVYNRGWTAAILRYSHSSWRRGKSRVRGLFGENLRQRVQARLSTF